MNATPSTEEKIISSAIVCIEKYGVQGTTNRKIAEEAGVNNAAINYYFRSKEALMKRCMEVTLHNAFDFEDFEQLPGGTAQERCAAIFNDLIVGGLNYPGLTRSHFYDVLANGNYDSLAVEKLNEFVVNLVADMKQRSIDLDEENLRMACMQITSTVMMAILAPRIFENSFGLDLTDESTRKAYVDRLVRQLLA
ncbi:MAG: TetR/AcrR family transcriptional regulator [Anaerolineaceae bacterium]|nr:TetR/AcrR family transcriptional regulator [Anaerolineaceae bacterium]